MTKSNKEHVRVFVFGAGSSPSDDIASSLSSRAIIHFHTPALTCSRRPCLRERTLRKNYCTPLPHVMLTNSSRQ